MKKLITPFLLLPILLVSCNKPKEKIDAGKTNGMLVTQVSDVLSREYQVLFSSDGFDSTQFQEYAQETTLDVDDDGVDDIRLSSSLIVGSLRKKYAMSYIESINPQYFIMRNINKNQYAIGEGNYAQGGYFSYIGTTPAVTYQAYSGCIVSGEPQTIYDYYVPDYFYKGEEIEVESNWVSDTELDFNLSNHAHLITYYELNTGNDTLIGTEVNYDFSCQNFVKNEDVYIPISKMVNTDRFLGWIKVRLSGENTIEILETAIQKH